MEMKSFKQYLSESTAVVNSHLEHAEDAILNGGVDGARLILNYFRELRDELSGKSSGAISKSLKFDGSPSVIAGVVPKNEPDAGKFFVAKKGVFNKTPKYYLTPKDIDDDTSGDLNAKLKAALEHLPKLGIKGVVQGDFLFSKSDLKKTKIDGQNYITFHPNTIVYAVPADTPLGKEVLQAEVGIAFHTAYTGDSFMDLSARFNVPIARNLRKNSKIWVRDSYMEDFSGTVSMTKGETDFVTSKLSEYGSMFRGTSAKALNGISGNEETLMRVKAYNNTKIRAGEKISNPDSHYDGLIVYLNDYYDKEIDKRKTEAGKEKIREKKKEILAYFDTTPKAQVVNIFRMMNLIVEIKEIFISKLNMMDSLRTFALTKDGYRVTNQEGFVVADHLGQNAYKLVDRLEFSYLNFGGAIRGWEK
jgi:hypothetical protein